MSSADCRLFFLYGSALFSKKKLQNIRNVFRMSNSIILTKIEPDMGQIIFIRHMLSVTLTS